MKKQIYQTRDYQNDLSRGVMESLHGISGRVAPDIREVFLSNYGYGYVWCFSRQDSFDDSLLCRIEKGGWFPLPSIANRPNAIDIAKDLREVYNNNPVIFSEIEFKNPFYDPCVGGDLIFAREQKERIKILLAREGGEQMARSLEGVLAKYKIAIP